MSIVGTAMNTLIRSAVGVNKKTSPLDDYDVKETRLFLMKETSAFQFSSDTEDLEKKPLVPVFVYCAMMKGGYFHEVLEGIHEGKPQIVFTVRRYHMWRSNEGRQSFPIAMAPKSKTPPILSRLYQRPTVKPAAGLVKGLLYNVRSDQMNMLDNLKHNGVLFDRKKVPVQLPTKIQDYDKYGCNIQDEDSQGVGRAWMYIGKPNFWDETLDKGFGYQYGACDVTDKAIRERNGISYQVSPRRVWMDEPFYYFPAHKVNHSNK